MVEPTFAANALSYENDVPFEDFVSQACALKYTHKSIHPGVVLLHHERAGPSKGGAAAGVQTALQLPDEPTPIGNSQNK
jgi:hypothetical protein